MRLPAQAAAVVREAYPWPGAGLFSPVSAVEPAGTVINCSDPTPDLCVCSNGVATCCPTTATGCSIDANGACSCTRGGRGP